MQNENLIIYVLIGERDIDKLRESIISVRHFNDKIPIVIYSTIDIFIQDIGITYRRVKLIPHQVREGNRNSSLYRLNAFFDYQYSNKVVCYLDNDINIVHDGFFEGFNIARNYGFCLPMNPRTWVTSHEKTGDMDIGADVMDYYKQELCGLPAYTTALNMGVMFVCNENKFWIDNELIFSAMKKLLIEHPGRGQAALYLAMKQTWLFPYILPQQFCACRDIEWPLAIHMGNKAMQKIFTERYFDVLT